MNESSYEVKEKIMKEYTKAIVQCAAILQSVDDNNGTYGEIEIKDVDVTAAPDTNAHGDFYRRYARQIEWRRIILQ